MKLIRASDRAHPVLAGVGFALMLVMVVILLTESLLSPPSATPTVW